MNVDSSPGIQMSNHSADLSLRKAALVAGLAYLIVFILTPNFWAGGLIAAGDATATANNIMASETLFRIGIVSWLIVLAADAVVAWALYHFFKPVNKSISLLGAWFRLSYVAIFAVNLLNWIVALLLIGGTGNSGVFEAVQLQDQAMLFFDAYNYGTNIAFVFFGLHIAVLGYLVLKSGFMPRILGILLMVASVGYLFDSFASFLSSSYANN